MRAAWRRFKHAVRLWWVDRTCDHQWTPVTIQHQVFELERKLVGYTHCDLCGTTIYSGGSISLHELQST